MSIDLVKVLGDLFRNVMSRKMFLAIKRHCVGNVLDIGGWTFYSYVMKLKLPIASWTCLEFSPTNFCPIFDDKYKLVAADGCQAPFKAESFDTVICIQVLEHVFEPLLVFSEILRVLKVGGHAIILVPQTTAAHAIPNFYQNFSIYWLRKVAMHFGFEIVEEDSLGGFWSTIFFRMVTFFLFVFKVPGFSSHEHTRGFVFYLLLPFMIVFALVSIPLCILFSLGDLSEDPNNNLIVMRKT